MGSDECASVVTPPDTGILTPPRTDEKKPAPTSISVLALLHLCRRRKTGRLAVAGTEDAHKKFKLTPLEWDKFEALAKADVDLWGFIQDKLRIDYDAGRSEAFVRMPSRIHDGFIVALHDHITKSLALRERQEDTLGRWLTKVDPLSTSDIYLDLEYKQDRQDKRSKRSPDAAYAVEDVYFPGIIIEVSYSQKVKDLPRLADDYILGSNGNIQMVLGLDLEYKKQKTAKAYVWRPAYKYNDITKENDLVADLTYESTFRNVDGLPSIAFDLAFTASDFCPVAFQPDLESDVSQTVVTFEAALLCKLLDRVELITTKAKEGYIAPLPPGVRKRQRSSSTEELAESDEAEFERQEVQASVNALAADPDFVPSTSRRPVRRRRY